MFHLDSFSKKDIDLKWQTIAVAYDEISTQLEAYRLTNVESLTANVTYVDGM